MYGCEEIGCHGESLDMRNNPPVSASDEKNDFDVMSITVSRLISSMNIFNTTMTTIEFYA